MGAVQDAMDLVGNELNRLLLATIVSFGVSQSHGLKTRKLENGEHEHWIEIVSVFGGRGRGVHEELEGADPLQNAYNMALDGLVYIANEVGPNSTVEDKLKHQKTSTYTEWN